MTDSNLDRELHEDEIREMLHLIEPDWHLRDATFMPDGITAIYRLRVDTGAGVTEYYLKATPLLPGADRRPRVGAEARVTECVRRHTDIPVPTVVGAVDAHDDVRTPFFLMEAMPGQDNDMDVLFDVSVTDMASLAREAGRYMGQLHDMETPNLDRFGQGITVDTGPGLRGDQPSGDPSELALPDGYPSWTEQMRDWVTEDLDALSESERFADLVDPIERCLTELLDQLPTAVSPVVGRVDHGLWNMLTDGDCRRSTAWLDWGSLFAVPPAFDLAVVEYFLGGGPWMVLPQVADYRSELQAALLEGYRSERPLPAAYDVQRRCYRLDTITVSLASLDKTDRKPRHLPANRVDEAAEGMRELTAELLSG